MSKIINRRELRNASAEVLRDVQAGQTVVISRHGESIVELRPVPRQRFVPRAVLAKDAAGAGRIDPNRFRADPDDVVDPIADA